MIVNNCSFQRSPSHQRSCVFFFCIFLFHSSLIKKWQYLYVVCVMSSFLKYPKSTEYDQSFMVLKTVINCIGLPMWTDFYTVLKMSLLRSGFWKQRNALRHSIHVINMYCIYKDNNVLMQAHTVNKQLLEQLLEQLLSPCNTPPPPTHTHYLN